MTSDEKRKACQLAIRLWENGELDRAADIIKRVLTVDPNDVLAVKVSGHVYEKAGNLPLAYHLFKRAVDLAPNDGNALANFGRVAQDLWRTQEAERAQLKAISMLRDPDEKANALTNLSALKCDMGLWEECAKYAQRAIELKPDSRNARANLGFAQLAQQNWSEGWANYRNTLGHDWRKRVQYKDEPEWDGTPGKRVVLYGEQGIGDEISFASMVPDAIRASAKVILDVDPRLAGLFRRSFPKATVYGTRMAKPGTQPWDKDDREFDASLAMGQIGEYYRTSPESFPGTPYLTADVDRVTMWKALFATKTKPTIGIAWLGGTPKSGAKFRQWTLEQLLPMFRAVDAHWVSLQYKPAEKEIAAFREKYPDVDLKEYAHGTLTTDYDDTAALVSACDLVICMQTAVAHLGGALGVPTWVFVPKISQWRYGGTGSTIPWYASVTVHRQIDSDWRRDIETASEALSAHFGKLPRGTAAAA